MTDLEKMQDSFNKTGVAFRVVNRTSERTFYDLDKQYPNHASTIDLEETCILFVFDVEGKYLGILQDIHGDGYAYTPVFRKG